MYTLIFGTHPSSREVHQGRLAEPVQSLEILQREVEGCPQLRAELHYENGSWELLPRTKAGVAEVFQLIEGPAWEAAFEVLLSRPRTAPVAEKLKRIYRDNIDDKIRRIRNPDGSMPLEQLKQAKNPFTRESCRVLCDHFGPANVRLFVEEPPPDTWVLDLARTAWFDRAHIHCTLGEPQAVPAWSRYAEGCAANAAVRDESTADFLAALPLSPGTARFVMRGSVHGPTLIRDLTARGVPHSIAADPHPPILGPDALFQIEGCPSIDTDRGRYLALADLLFVNSFGRIRWDFTAVYRQPLEALEQQFRDVLCNVRLPWEQRLSALQKWFRSL